jgi:hypothetical protein
MGQGLATSAHNREITRIGAGDRFSILLNNKSLFLKTALDTDYESCEVHLD